MTGEAWRQHLQTYLALRRAIGFTMQREARLLQDFVEHLERRGDDAPVAQVAVEWASASTESQHARRLSIVRGFLTMVRAADPDVDVPGAGLVRTSKRPTPRILAPHEVLALMEAARSLGPRDALRPHTVATVIGLLASCGLRAGEAIHLDIDDVDLVSALPCLQIQRTKFRKSRLVPLHPTTAAALQAYYPLVVHRNPNGVPQPLGDRDVETATACALALSAFLPKHAGIFQADSFTPVCESYFDDDREVRFTVPYEAIADFKLNEPAEQERDAYLKPTPPAEPFQPRVGRNRPCPCGSGRKYNKCHLPADEAEHDANRSLAATLPPLRDTRIGWIPARAGGGEPREARQPPGRSRWIVSCARWWVAEPRSARWRVPVTRRRGCAG